MQDKTGPGKGSRLFPDSVFHGCVSSEAKRRDNASACQSACAASLRSKYDYVIVDAPAGIDDGMIIATGGCDMGIIVVTPEYASLRNAETVKKTIKAQGIDNICYVVNRIDLRLIESGKAPSFDEVTKNIREKIVGIIQEDENIHVSTNLGVPIVSMTDTYIAKSFMAMADRIKKNLEKE